jgi:serine/threonine-protein kinase RsbW
MVSEGQMDQPIVRLTTRTDPKLFPAVQQYIRAVAAFQGFTEAELLKIELLVEEAFLKIVEDAFEGRNDEHFDIIVEQRPGQFVLAFEDKGLPINMMKVQDPDSDDIGMALLRGVSDEVNFINLGKSGNRMEFIKGLTLWENRFPPQEDGSEERPERSASDVPFTIRKLRSDEGNALQRCIYRVYGYTYAEDLYYPERIRERIESGIQVSFVAVTGDNEIMGHQAYVKSDRDARVADVAIGMVDPRYRGMGLFALLKSTAIEHAREQGLYGFYGEAVTAHPRSQKVNIGLGARETGIMLGYVPQSLTFKSLSEHHEGRQPTLLIFNRLNKEPERTVYPPSRHRDMICRIYENASFARTVTVPDRNWSVSQEQTQCVVKVSVDLSLAFIRITDFGCDFREVVHSNLRQLCCRKIEGIFIDLPLSHPETALQCQALEAMGFFFSGIIPEFAEGDILRMQYLNNVTLDLDNVVLITDFGRELYDYCTSEYGRVQRV